jgi:hypothetical protein
MKNPFPVLILLSCASFSAHPQVTMPAGDAAAATWPTIAALRGFAATERSSYQTRWSRIEAKTNAAGRVFMRTNSFVELGAGLNRWVGNQWVASMPQIQPAPGGALGSNARHQVWFASDLNTEGAVALTGPDGRSIRSQILGLSYYDATTGTNVLIATTKSCQGQIMPSQRQVLYTNAFAGVRADVRYTYTMAGLEQDVILRQQLAAPEAYGLNSQTTELEVLTEYLDVPTRCVPGVSEDVIEFGAMHFARGRAFTSELPQGRIPIKLQVSRHWAQLAGRNFLIESLPAAAARAATANLTNTHASILNYKPLPARQYPALPETVKSGEPMLLAETCPTLSGFVLDWYITLSADSRDAYTFQAGSMYLISDILTVTNATFEGATVLKYSPYATMFVSNIVSMATQYEPVTFTSQEDNSISWDVSTGNNNYCAEEFLVIGPRDGMVTVSNMHFRNMPSGLFVNGGSLDLWDCQFFNCTYATGLGPGLPSQTNAQSLHLHNVLFSGCGAPVVVIGVSNVQVTAEQVTADAFAVFCVGALYPLAQVQLMNCLYTGGLDFIFQGGTLCAYLDPNSVWTNTPTPVTNQVFCFTDSTGIFASSGAGNYYLGDTNLWDAGDTNISSRMASELQQLTTVPPLAVTNTCNGDPSCPIEMYSGTLNMPPRLICDTNTPDIGYHYPTVDYLVSHFAITNAVLSIGEGTVITYEHDAGGIWLGDGAQLQCLGSPEARNVFVCYSAVQEQPLKLSDGSDAWYSQVINSTRSNGGLETALFGSTDFLGLPGENDLLNADSCCGYSLLTMTNCRIAVENISWVPTYSAGIDIENNLFSYTALDAESSGPGTPGLIAANNLFYNCSLVIAAESGWTIASNTLDHSSLAIPSSGSVRLDCNTFLDGATLAVWANESIIPPTNTTVCALMPASFSVGTTNPLLSYQWFRGSNVLVGQTSSSLLLPSVCPADADMYAVRVSAPSDSIYLGARLTVLTLLGPRAPTNLWESDISAEAFTINWEPVENVDGYCFDVDTRDGTFEHPFGFNLDVTNQTSFLIAQNFSGDVWHYRVRAYYENPRRYSTNSVVRTVGPVWGTNTLLSYSPSDALVTWTDATNGTTTGTLSEFNSRADYGTVTHIWLVNKQITHVSIGNLLASLETLDLSGNRLTTLRCANQSLQALNVAENPQLAHLLCMYNIDLNSLNISGDTALEELTIFWNSISEIDLSALTNLLYLDVGFSNLQSLDVSHNTKLLALFAPNTGLTNLDLSSNTALQQLGLTAAVLWPSGPSITNINLSQNTALQGLDVGNSCLTNLDLSHNTNLVMLNVSGSSCLTSVDVSQSRNLMWLAANCPLTSLDLSRNPIVSFLDCSDSAVTNLDLSCDPWLQSVYCNNCGLRSLEIAPQTVLTNLCSTNNSLTASAIDEILARLWGSGLWHGVADFRGNTLSTGLPSTNSWLLEARDWQIRWDP